MFVGFDAGVSNIWGYKNTYVGYFAGYSDYQKLSATNSTAIGAGTFTTRNNQVVIGDENVVETQLRANVYIGSTSSTSHTPLFVARRKALSIFKTYAYV